MDLSTHRLSTTFRLIAAGLLAITIGWFPARAEAQIFKVCGDVDEDNVVTVTDGVQVLRAAAELSSDCTPAICDVDVSGTITVTDGVTTLRKAAGLSIKDNCIPDDGRIDQQIAYLLQFSEPLVSAVLPTIVLHRNESVDNSFECDNGDEGTYDISVTDGQQDNTFSTCEIDNALIDGSVDNANDDPLLSIDLGDVRNDDTITLEGKDGTQALLGVNIEGGVKYSGLLDAGPSFERFDQTSDFLLVLQNLQVPINGFPLGGLLSYELTKDSGISGVHRIRVLYDGSNLARVEVQFTNGDFKYYKFELQFLNFIS